MGATWSEIHPEFLNMTTLLLLYAPLAAWDVPGDPGRDGYAAWLLTKAKGQRRWCGARAGCGPSAGYLGENHCRAHETG